MAPPRLRIRLNKPLAFGTKERPKLPSASDVDGLVARMSSLPPHPEVPEALAALARTSLRLVAAHHWDIAGALSAGCQAAFVARPRMVLSPLAGRPGIVGPDLASVADQIIAADA